jgi:hypothetical protein
MATPDARSVQKERRKMKYSQEGRIAALKGLGAAGD